MLKIENRFEEIPHQIYSKWSVFVRFQNLVCRSSLKTKTHDVSHDENLGVNKVPVSAPSFSFLILVNQKNSRLKDWLTQLYGPGNAITNSPHFLVITLFSSNSLTSTILFFFLLPRIEAESKARKRFRSHHKFHPGV